MFYDYALTFSREVELFWKGPASAATYLYFANRYLTLVEKIFNFFWWIPNMSPEVRSVCPWSPPYGLTVVLAPEVCIVALLAIHDACVC